MCKSHGPENFCPKKDEIGTKCGRQRLKELLQEMVKSEEKSKLDKGKNGKIREIDQRAWVLEAPPLEITKKEFVGPKVVQPPEGKIPSVKPIELGVEPNGHLSQQPAPNPNIWVVQEGNLRESPHKRHLMPEGEGIKMDRRRNNPHLDPLPEKMVEMEVMAMMVMMEMMMGMMKMMMRMTMMMK